MVAACRSRLNHPAAAAWPTMWLGSAHASAAETRLARAEQTPAGR